MADFRWFQVVSGWFQLVSAGFRLFFGLVKYDAYSLVIQKVFLFQMLEETSIFTLPGKIPL